MSCIHLCGPEMGTFIDGGITKVFLLSDRLFKRLHENDDPVPREERFIQFHFAAFCLCPFHINAASAQDLPDGIFRKVDAVPNGKI